MHFFSFIGKYRRGATLIPNDLNVTETATSSLTDATMLEQLFRCGIKVKCAQIVVKRIYRFKPVG